MHSFKALAGVLIMVVVTPCVADSPPPIHEEIDQTARLFLEQFHIAGAAVCAIDDGEVIHQGLYGFANTSTGEPITAETRFQIASISKLFAAWSIMILEQEGRLDLDEPIWNSISSWRIGDSEFDEDGVTARRLLSHTAGTSLWGIPNQLLGTTLPSTRQWLESGDEGSPPVFLEAEPGSRHRYSGGGMTILQLAIEELTRRPYDEFVRERVCLPLGMTTFGFNLSPDDWMAGAPHDALGQPKSEWRIYPSLAAAAGWASLDDMKRFFFAHFDSEDGPRGGSVLEPENFDRMFELQAEANYRWGLGYEAMAFEPNKPAYLVSHTGDNPGWHSLFYVVREGRDALIILTNGELGYAFRNMIRPVWSRAVGLEHPFPERPAPVGPTLIGIATEQGADAAIAEYRRREAEEPEKYNFGVRQLNDLAYFLWEARRFDEGMKILEFNAELYPEEETSLDSLAEGHYELGQYAKAEEIYRKVLEITPGNKHVLKMIEKIRDKRGPDDQ